MKDEHSLNNKYVKWTQSEQKREKPEDNLGAPHRKHLTQNLLLSGITPLSNKF